MLKDEGEHSWQLLLPHAILSSMGIVEQETINEYGEIIPKWWLTHDMSFDIVNSTYQSVNHWVICEELTPSQYGTAILHHIHFIFHLCL
jgi:hypothetical protein